MTRGIVMKFGGAAVSAPERFSEIAELVIHRQKEFSRVAVVVSAMGSTTDDLITLAHRVNPSPPRREMDMLVSVGERISTALLAMALAGKGFEAISFTGSQTGIITSNDHTEARIVDVRPKRIHPHIERNTIIIVAGFQGMSQGGEITTLGRGGSDTTAVALAAALGAEKVEFFKDVSGIYDCDPTENASAVLHRELSFADAGKIISTSGHHILSLRSVVLAQKNGIPLHVLPFADALNPNCGTWIGRKEVEDGILSRPDSPIYET